MRWPWQKASENRGTLTFLADGIVVFGAPHGTTDADVFEVCESIRLWQKNGQKGRIVVFPWPVDVVDKR